MTEVETPEQHRDDIVGRIQAAGGVILNTSPMATESEPHVVAGYHLEVRYPTITARDECQLIEAETEVEGLIPWTPDPQPPIPPEEPIEWPESDENGEEIDPENP